MLQASKVQRPPAREQTSLSRRNGNTGVSQDRSLSFKDQRVPDKTVRLMQRLAFAQPVQRYRLSPGSDEFLREGKFFKGADQIQFSTFNSCIGIVGRTKEKKINGIHLGFKDAEGELISDKKKVKETAEKVAHIFDGCNSYAVFGFTTNEFIPFLEEFDYIKETDIDYRPEQGGNSGQKIGQNHRLTTSQYYQ